MTLIDTFFVVVGIFYTSRVVVFIIECVWLATYPICLLSGADSITGGGLTKTLSLLQNKSSFMLKIVVVVPLRMRHGIATEG